MYADDGYQPYHPRSVAPKTPPVCKALLIANVVTFLLYAITYRANPSLYRDLTHLFGLVPDLALKQLHLWQFLTYTFLHDVRDVWHVIFNLLFLFWFGREVETKFGSRRFLKFYLAAGACAGLAHCAVNVFSRLSVPVIGASGAVMAVLVVYAIYFPNRTILFLFVFPMRIRNFVMLLIGVDLFMCVMALGNGVANLAHLGGAAYGLLYMKYLPALGLFLRHREQRQQGREEEREEEEESRLDAILDKVHREGLHSLTRGEKAFLTRMSRRKGG